MLSVTYAECHLCEGRNAELNVIMPTVFVLNVIILSVVMLNVVAPNNDTF
jgi:hypothetical protein